MTTVFVTPAPTANDGSESSEPTFVGELARGDPPFWRDPYQSGPDGNVLESDDGDNTACTYIRVTGEEIGALERGRGDSPWDPRRQVVHDARCLMRRQE